VFPVKYEPEILYLLDFLTEGEYFIGNFLAIQTIFELIRLFLIC
jgi:hypothetical protein